MRLKRIKKIIMILSTYRTQCLFEEGDGHDVELNVVAPAQHDQSRNNHAASNP